MKALQGNLAWIRHRAGNGVQVMAVVKADAYGHGLQQIAALLMQSGADLFGVANLTEAQSIRAVGKGWPILMLGACLPHEIAVAVADAVMPVISSLDEAAAFEAAARKARKMVDVHVKVDTGMGRLGVAPALVVELVEAIQRMKNVRCAGICTHYSSAEEEHDFSAAQAAEFEAIIKELKQRQICPPLVHANNSAALLHQPSTIYNLVRPGLLMYGLVPPGPRVAELPLSRNIRATLSFRCRVSLVKEIAKGTPLSYGRSFVAPRRMQVATITAGYGDGFPRAGSNRAEVLIRGARCRALGKITMDQTIVDVTGVSGVRRGDEAVLIGRQGDDEITATELAARCDTVPWDVLTGITYRVPRLYRGGQAA